MPQTERSQYWPLARGLSCSSLPFPPSSSSWVPYLPSYGGYVRYAVGIVFDGGMAGIYVISGHATLCGQNATSSSNRVMERNGVRHTATKKRMKKMNANLCPGCERPIFPAGRKGFNQLLRCTVGYEGPLFDN
jgi:hypothetical protein